MTGRDAFLERVRQAVEAGNQAGKIPKLPERGGVGYQGGGPDPVERFAAMLQAAGGQFSRAASVAQAQASIVAWIQARQARRVLLGLSPLLERLALRGILEQHGLEVIATARTAAAEERAALFSADIAVTGADYLIAETGSLAMLARPGRPRLESLLPPAHLVVLERGQLLLDLFDLFERLEPASGLPSCVTLITGPSKTGDIELKLVTGVHGPGDVHVLLVDAGTN